MTRMQRILIGIALGFTGTFTSNAQWTMTTQPAQATDANCFAVHGSTLFAAMGNDGIFSTTDNGATWTPCNTGLTDTDVRAMAAVYTSGGYARLLAGTSSGAFYSTNEGAGWKPCAVLVNAAVRAFASGTDSLNIYAGFVQKGVYVSTDGGVNWAPANKGIAQEFITARENVHGRKGERDYMAVPARRNKPKTPYSPAHPRARRRQRLHMTVARAETMSSNSAASLLQPASPARNFMVNQGTGPPGQRLDTNTCEM